MSIRAPGKSKNWRGLAFYLAMILFDPSMISARATGFPTRGLWSPRLC